MNLKWSTLHEIADAYGYTLAQALGFVDSLRCAKVFRQDGILALVPMPLAKAA